MLFGGLAAFYFMSGINKPSRSVNTLIPTGAESGDIYNPIDILKNGVASFGEACARWGVGSRQAYGHATTLATADFSSSPLNPSEIREMRTEFAETIVERGEYEEAVSVLTDIIAEADDEFKSQNEIGTVASAGYKSRFGEAQAGRAVLLAFSYQQLDMPGEAYESYRSARRYLGGVYGGDHPNLIYVFQDEIATAEWARDEGYDVGNLLCAKRDLGIMQIRAVSEGFVDDDEMDLIVQEPHDEVELANCPPAPIIPSDTPVESIKLFFGTNRNLSKSRHPKSVYGSKRGKLTLGSVDMTVRVYPKVGDLPPVGIEDAYLDDDGDDKSYGVHIVLTKLNKLSSKNEFQTQLSSWVQNSPRPTKEIFVYIHGHNVVFEMAAQRAAQLAIDLDMRHGGVFYTWPAGQRITLYAKSQTNAKRSAKHLTEFLELLGGTEGIDKIHLIAHSMGNDVLTRALDQIEIKGYSAENRAFGQIIWASPDVAADSFVEYISNFKNRYLAEGMTLYASSLDRALSLSNFISEAKRAGQTPPWADVAQIVPTIDTTSAYRSYKDLIAHADYADGALDDIKAVLWHGLRPDQRCFLGTDLVDNIPYWSAAEGRCSEASFRAALSVIRSQQYAQLTPGFNLDERLKYIRRDVDPIDWETAQLLASEMVAD